MWNSFVKLAYLFGKGGVVGPNFAVDKTACIKVGGFRSIHTEDSDLSLRIIKAGRLVYLEDNEVKTSVRRFKRWGIIRFAFIGIICNLQILFGGKPSLGWEKID